MIVMLNVKLYLVLITILQPNCQNIYRGGGPVRFPQQDPDLIHPPFPCQRGSDITPPHPNPKWNFSSWSKIFSFWTKLVRITFSFLDPIFYAYWKWQGDSKSFLNVQLGTMNHGAQLTFLSSATWIMVPNYFFLSCGATSINTAVCPGVRVSVWVSVCHVTLF